MMVFRIAEESGHGASIDPRGEFARALHELIAVRRPRRILETGTHRGEGSTRIICEALAAHRVDASFVSIEADPEHAEAARALAEREAWPVDIKTGLSLPRWMLPTADEIGRELEFLRPLGVWADYADDATRAEQYAAEVPASGATDLIGTVLDDWDGRADLVLLDSAGHLGTREFHYLTRHLTGPAFIALDDTRHVKHCRSITFALTDARFRAVAGGEERFGWAVLEFNP